MTDWQPISTAPRGFTITPIFAWYDMWIGAFWDAAKRRLYVFPVPMLGVLIQFPAKSPLSVQDSLGEKE